jgi:hypothetical protein
MGEFERIVKEIERQRPGDVARVQGLLRRSDALHNVIVGIGDEGCFEQESEEETLEVLQVMLEEVNEEFDRSKRELGIPEWRH